MVLKSFPQIQLPNDPAASLQTGTKQYIDAADATKQPLDSDLTTIAGLTATSDNFMVAASSAWASRTPTQAKASLAIVESDVSGLVTDLAAKAPTSRNLTAGTGLTGGGDLSADRTFTVAYGTTSTTACVGNDSRVTGAAPTASPTFTGTATFAKIVTVPVALTDAATIVVDASLGNHFRVTLAASGHVFGTPSNPTDGQKILFEIIQDGTGSRTMTTWNSPYTFGTDVIQPTLTTTASKRDFVGFVYNSTASLWYCLAVAKGY